MFTVLIYCLLFYNVTDYVDYVYSHIPFNKRVFSRTRIDFWLVSNNISTYVKDVTYLPLISELFYHKPVQLVLTSNIRVHNSVNPKLLNISESLFSDLASARFVFKLLKDLLKLKNEIPTDKLLEIFISNCCHSIDNQIANIHP